MAKMSPMLMPAAFSISASASTKAMPRRSATRRPIDDLPAPIMPTSTIERRPSAAVTAASGLAARSCVAPWGIILRSYWFDQSRV
jgi:hypothetical protein